MDKFPYIPLAAGYSVGYGDGRIISEVADGMPKSRLDATGRPQKVNVEWLFDSYEYQVFKAFYHTRIKEGALPFLLDLKLEEAASVETHEVLFDSVPTEASTGGINVRVRASLYAKPAPRNTDYDDIILGVAMEEQEAQAFAASLHEVMTQVLPSF